MIDSARLGLTVRLAKARVGRPREWLSQTPAASAEQCGRSFWRDGRGILAPERWLTSASGAAGMQPHAPNQREWLRLE